MIYIYIYTHIYIIYWIYVNSFRILFVVNYHFIKMNGFNHSKNKSDINLFNWYEIIVILFMFINQIICFIKC